MLNIRRKNWFSILSMVSLVATIALSAGCTDEGEPEPEPSVTPSTGPVTVSVIKKSQPQTPVAGVLVAINSEDGALVTSGMTDAAGKFTAQEVPYHSSISVANAAPNAGYDTILQTTFDIQTGGTYNFVVPTDPVPSETATVLSLPGFTYSNPYFVLAGSCKFNYLSGGAFYPTNLSYDCLDNDGKLTVAIYFMSVANGPATGGLMYSDVLPVIGGTTIIDPSMVDGTVSFDRTIQLGFNNAPQTMEVSAGAKPWVDVQFQRKGRNYDISNRNGGVVSGNSFTGLAITYPSALVGPNAAEGTGYYLSFGSSFKRNDGVLTYGGFVNQNSNRAFWTFDLAQMLPSDLTISGTFIDTSEISRPEVSWTAPATNSFDGAMLSLHWKNSATVRNAWFALAPQGQGYLRMPELPSSMAGYAPASGAQFDLGAIYLMDTSWQPDYESYARNESAMTITTLGGVKAAGGATLKYSAAYLNDGSVSPAAARLSAPGSIPLPGSTR